MSAVRLQKYLAACGVGSRRGCERLIQEGRVVVNGTTAAIGQQVTPGVDEVRVNGETVVTDKKVYVVFNKPADVVTTLKDTHSRKTVGDFFDGLAQRVFPVGRLDRDVEGVLLFTNDGELAFRLTHPRYKINKVYLVWVKGQVTPETVKRLEQGVQLDDGVTAPARVSVINAGVETSHIKLTIHEGRKREVKRMCAAVGHPVKTLRRVAFAGVNAKGLRPGEWRYLADEEIKEVRTLAGLD